MYVDKVSRIYVAGHTGFLGSTLIKKLENNGFHNIIPEHIKN